MDGGLVQNDKHLNDFLGLILSENSINLQLDNRRIIEELNCYFRITIQSLKKYIEWRTKNNL